MKLPKITYTNMKKESPKFAPVYSRWFNINRYWGGRLIQVDVKWHCFVIDFRVDFMKDLIEGSTDKDRP